MLGAGRFAKAGDVSEPGAVATGFPNSWIESTGSPGRYRSRFRQESRLLTAFGSFGTGG